MDGSVSRTDVKDAVAGTPDAEEIVRAMNITLQRLPEDPMSFFRNAIRKKANVMGFADEGPIVKMVADPDPKDPFQD